MLNRRTLRIKIMQSLFAYEQCKEANHLLAADFVDSYFQPNLNSMKVQDKELLKGQRAIALKLFEKRFQGESVEESSDPRIAESIDQALALHVKQTKKDFSSYRKNLVLQVEKINSYYLATLNLILAFDTTASIDKKIGAGNFVNNPLVNALRQNHELKKETLRNGGGWDQKMDLVRGWFRDCIKPDKEFQTYLGLTDPDMDAHKAFVKHLVRKLILGATPINGYFEEEDLHWAEDHEIVRSMSDKTLKSLDEHSVVEIQKLSLNWEEDKEFIDKLFVAAVQLDKKYHDLIANNTKNWEVDRLPLTDRVILQMAIAELTEFPNIPVKVTINEYIELAKLYSTPKSRQFINGILDVMAKELKLTGQIKKSGRGLMDNK